MIFLRLGSINKPAGSASGPVIAEAASTIGDRVWFKTLLIQVVRLETRVARGVTLGKKRHRLALALSVEDNGPGVPEAIRERIFYPLVSGRDGGSGLGLTIAQTFVAQHGGTIEWTSVPGRTVFTILLPLDMTRGPA